MSKCNNKKYEDQSNIPCNEYSIYNVKGILFDKSKCYAVMFDGSKVELDENDIKIIQSKEEG